MDLSCVDNDLGSAMGLAVATGNNAGESDDWSPTCAGAGGRDVTFFWTAPAAGDYVFSTHDTSYDSVLSAVQPDCVGSEIACNDFVVFALFGAELERTMTAGEQVVVVLDAVDAAQVGSYQLDIQAPLNSCAGQCGSAPALLSFPDCYCDPPCHLSGDCCSDVCDAGACQGDVAACPGSSETVTAGPGLGLVILDDAYTGVVASMTCVDLDVPGAPSDQVYDIEVEVGIDHAFVGDLTVKVAPPSSGPVALLSRPGFDEPADDGADGFGDSSDFVALSPVSFRVGHPFDAETMGASLDLLAAVCQDDAECEFFPNEGAAQFPISSLSGVLSAGTWQVCVGDSDPFVQGTIDFVRLVVYKA